MNFLDWIMVVLQSKNDPQLRTKLYVICAVVYPICAFLAFVAAATLPHARGLFAVIGTVCLIFGVVYIIKLIINHRNRW